MLEGFEDLVKKAPIVAQGLSDAMQGFELTQCPYSALHEPVEYDQWTTGHDLHGMYKKGDSNAK